jgi:hypothetical protein
MKMLRLLIDIGNITTLAAAAAIEGTTGFTTSSLYLAIFNLLAETTNSLQVLDMPLVEIDDEDMRVLFNLATCCHTSHLRVHVYLAIFNLLAETASSLHVLDMLLVEIDDEDTRVLFNLATRCHTLRICESMKIDQTLPFLKVTVHPRLQGRLHCRYHCSFTIYIKIFVFIGSLWNIVCLCWFIVGICLRFGVFFIYHENIPGPRLISIGINI